MKGFVVFLLVLGGILFITTGYIFYEKLRNDYHQSVPIALIGGGAFAILIAVLFNMQTRTDNFFKWIFMGSLISNIMDFAR